MFGTQVTGSFPDINHELGISSTDSLGGAFRCAIQLPHSYRQHRTVSSNLNKKTHPVTSAIASLFAATGASDHNNTLIKGESNFSTGFNFSRIQRLGSESLPVPHTRISSLVSSVLAIPLAFINTLLKIGRIAVHIVQIGYYIGKCLFSDDAHAKNKLIFTLGALLGDLFSLIVEPLRAIYVIVKHALGFFSLTLANGREWRTLNKVLVLYNATPIPTPSPFSRQVNLQKKTN